MLQLENINTIEYLNEIFKKLEIYHIDVSEYQKKLDLYVREYENNKKISLENERDGVLSVASMIDYEMKLWSDLDWLRSELKIYILFLDVMDVSDNCNLDSDIEEFFNKVDSNFKSLIESFSEIELQKKIISGYYDILFLKIINDYKNGKQEYLEKYHNLKESVHLRKSVEKYLESNQVKLDRVIENYDLNAILDKVFVLTDDNVQEVSGLENSEVGMCHLDADVRLVGRLNKYAWLGKNKKEVIKILKDEYGIFWRRAIKNKLLHNISFEGIDLSDVNFDGVSIEKTSLKDTKARIDLNKANGEPFSLSGCYVLDNYSTLEYENLSFLDEAIMVDSFEEIERIESGIMEPRYYYKYYESISRTKKLFPLFVSKMSSRRPD